MVIECIMAETRPHLSQHRGEKINQRPATFDTLTIRASDPSVPIERVGPMTLVPVSIQVEFWNKEADECSKERNLHWCRE